MFGTQARNQISLVLLGAVALSLLSVDTLANVINPISQDRRIEATAFSGQGRSISASAGDFDPWSVSAGSSRGPVESAVSQDSDLGLIDPEIAALLQSTSQALSDPAGGSTTADSSLSYGFSLDAPQSFSLFAAVSTFESEPWPAALAVASFTFSGPDGSIASLQALAGDSDSIKLTGILPPGFYHVTARSTSEARASSSTSDRMAASSVQFVIAIPEPQSILMFAILLLLSHARIRATRAVRAVRETATRVMNSR